MRKSSFMTAIIIRTRSFFNGFDTRHTVQEVTNDNLRLNGKLTKTAAEANLSVGPCVSGVRFGTAAK